MLKGMNGAMKNISIKEIAKLAGVSSATVSRVLNNNGRFSEDTRKRVMDLVGEFDYRTNVVAKSLRTSKSQSIGVIVPDITNEFFAHVLLAIENYCFPREYSVFICNTNEEDDKEKLYIKDLESKGVDGIIYLAGRMDIERSMKSSVPIVCIDRNPIGRDAAVIESDNVRGGFLATELLIQRSCRNIVILKNYREFSTTLNRYKGYCMALNQYNLIIKPELVLDIPVKVEAARTAITQLIRKKQVFDGIFATTDWLAVGALTALKEHDIKVPEQVKIVGFDNISIAEYNYPGITSVNQDKNQLGEQAATILLEMIDKKEVINRKIVIPVNLIIRGTA